MNKSFIFRLMCCVSLIIACETATETQGDRSLHRILVDGLYGFIDQTGTVVIEPQFYNAGDFSGLGCEAQVDA